MGERIENPERWAVLEVEEPDRKKKEEIITIRKKFHFQSTQSSFDTTMPILQAIRCTFQLR